MDPSKVVVVHGGARDNYQLALALEEGGLLEALVTDLFWPADARWARWLEGKLPTRLKGLLRQRSQVSLPAHRVRQTPVSGLVAHVADLLPFVPFSAKRRIRRWSDDLREKRTAV